MKSHATSAEVGDLSTIRVIALAGGVGGAKMVHGLSQLLPPDRLTVIVNTGDDFSHFGLHVCPDLDTVCYTLAGIASKETGWGRAGESWQAMESVAQLQGPVWFRLGDLDLGTHLERTRRLIAGELLSEVTRDFCRSWGIKCRVLPMSDDSVSTRVMTEEGELTFQHYFVARRCEPGVRGFRFQGVESARPAPGVLEAISGAHLSIICPSNPWVSVDPILSLTDVKDHLARKPVLAVSPIIGGQAVKGPAAKMFSELGITPSAEAVARHYGPLLSGFVLDEVDRAQASEIEGMGVRTLVTDVLMRDEDDRRRLAAEVLVFARELLAHDRES